MKGMELLPKTNGGISIIWFQISVEVFYYFRALTEYFVFIFIYLNKI